MKSTASFFHASQSLTSCTPVLFYEISTVALFLFRLVQYPHCTRRFQKLFILPASRELQAVPTGAGPLTAICAFTLHEVWNPASHASPSSLICPGTKRLILFHYGHHSLLCLPEVFWFPTSITLWFPSPAIKFSEYFSCCPANTQASLTTALPPDT